MLTVNVLGKEVSARISNLRRIDWTSLGINFVMVFSPGLLERAPQSEIATVQVASDQELALERAVVAQFPNVTAIRVKEVLEDVNKIPEPCRRGARDCCNCNSGRHIGSWRLYCCRSSAPGIRLGRVKSFRGDAAADFPRVLGGGRSCGPPRIVHSGILGQRRCLDGCR